MRRPPAPRQAFRTRPAHRGFTLLEVLVALALASLLISAVYAGLTLYFRYSVAGQDEAERSQVARTVLRQIELDLRSVVYQAASSGSGQPASSGGSSSSGAGPSGASASGGTGGSKGNSGTAPQNTPTLGTSQRAGNTTQNTLASNSSSSSGGSSGQNSSTGETEPTTPDSAYTSSSSGLFGDANTLMMHVSKPSRTETYAPFASGVPGGRTSDLLSIAYFVGGQGGGALQSATSSGGLARLAGDRLMMSVADQQGNTALLASKTEVLAPEVVSITFGYFDGSSWLETWDSSSQGGLPKAVEIVLELEPQSGRRVVRKTYWGPPTENIYRLTVALPAGGSGSSSSSE